MKDRMPVPSKMDSTILQNLRLVSDAGINVVTGTDAGNIGTQHAASYYTELQAMQQSGMTNAQILKAATINAAKGFGRDSMIGSIDAGKFANLLLLNSNPLEKLSAINDIHLLVNRGHVIKADTLLLVTPESLVQQQLNAYNARNMEAFLAPYSDSVELFEFPHTPYVKGKDAMRTAYTSMFDNVKNLHCKLANRMVQGNTIIDQEVVTGFGDATIKAIAVYTIKNGKIQQVHFIQ